MGVLNSGRALGRRFRRHPRLLLASSSIVDTASASQLPTWKLIPYACQQWSASTRTSLAPSPSVPYTRSFHNPSWYTRNPLSFPKLSHSTFDSWLERYFPWLWLAKLYFLDWRKRSLSVRVLRLVCAGKEPNGELLDGKTVEQYGFVDQNTIYLLHRWDLGLLRSFSNSPGCSSKVFKGRHWDYESGLGRGVVQDYSHNGTKHCLYCSKSWYMPLLESSLLLLFHRRDKLSGLLPCIS